MAYKTTPYARGRNKEYRIMNYYKSLGYICLRSAGSHSPIDVVAIHPNLKEIVLIQSKLGYENKTTIKKIEEEIKMFDGTYKVISKLIN